MKIDTEAIIKEFEKGNSVELRVPKPFTAQSAERLLSAAIGFEEAEKEYRKRFDTWVITGKKVEK